MILPMVNIPFVKQLWSAMAGFIEIGRWVGRNRKERDRAIVGYNLNSFLGVAATLASAVWKTDFIYLFTDPPYSNTRKGPVWKAAYRINAAMVRYAVGRSAGIAAVNAGAVQAYAPGKPYCIVEGGVEPGAGNGTQTAQEAKTIVYTGGLSPHNGLENLIDGFMLTQDPAYRLKIYGKGVLEQGLKQRAAPDGRIEFPGYLSTQDITGVQQRAAVLANPRPSILEINRTTFPSKLMEYLASGRPVLTTRLPGIPPEYEPYLAFVADESPHGFADAIDRLLGMGDDALARVGDAGRKFVLENKNWDRQAARLSDFVSGITGGTVK